MHTIFTLLFVIAIVGAVFNVLDALMSGVVGGSSAECDTTSTEGDAKPSRPKRKTRTRSRQVPEPEYAVIEQTQTELYTTPSIKEYVLPDGSKVAVDTEETQVTETKAMPVKSSAERFGGGMAEIIRKRREAEVF